MANKRIKLVTIDSDGDKDQVFAETDQYSVIGLEARLASIEADIQKLKNKTGVN
ncbi:hypothetical protein [Liquorilactobacillus nagelii]|jgi:hypothetical protein|uniref:hypothetical protein n=1 Tax=Liquorilactobacillus nagelii TaxID=82688 RepID=UPI0024308EE2|nr:hypothetical protein [Liquorilactobacillus nagelii]MCI1699981.1 hypothetical protein [Liquorilactobacillus nagelii]